MDYLFFILMFQKLVLDFYLKNLEKLRKQKKKKKEKLIKIEKYDRK
ncbi:MAG: hypothetical protein PWQ59_1782 [Thermoanaerobacterium sp.]|jgi:hypothetical protein|nr:hypothetical protein [Thermoanaerobacterium sp.]